MGIGRPLFWVFIFCQVLAEGEAFASRLPTNASLWKGEYLRTDQGGVTFSAISSAMKPTPQTIQVIVQHLKSKQRFVMLHSFIKRDEISIAVWKLPVGKYKIEAITVAHGPRIRTWYGTKQNSFTVKNMTLSNLGRWSVRPRMQRYLQVKFLKTMEGFLARRPEGRLIFGSVIDGFSGREVEKLKGGTKLANHRNNFGRVDEMRAVITRTRQISMFYKMDLKRHSRFNYDVLPVLQGHDARLRQCYIDGLESNYNLKGTVQFAFKLKNHTGNMESVQYRGGTLRNRRMQDCLHAELAQMQFPVKKPITGHLVFNFKVSD